MRLSESTDAQLAEYRSLSGWAIVGLILGLGSPLALADPMLWTVPIVGIIVSAWALSRIKQNAPAMIGRKAALVGLWIAVFSLAAASGDWLYYRWRIRGEARQVAAFWFQLLAKNRPELAFQLTLPPQQRQAFDERIQDFYKESDKWSKALENYIAPAKPGEPPRPVHSVLALGGSAQPRYIKTLDQIYVGSAIVVDQLYAVTYEDSGEKKTFFVSIRLIRDSMNNGRAFWRIIGDQSVDQNGKTPSESNPT